jgi:ankyrin repeat protein
MAIEKKVNTTVLNKNLEKALKSYLKTGSGDQAELIKDLLAKGADANLLVLDPDGTGVKHSVLWYLLDTPDIVQVLIEKGANVDVITDTGGLSPLHNTIGYGSESYFRTTRLLVENGANVNSSKNSGETVLMAAVKSAINDEERVSLVQLLVEKGANSDATDSSGRTALQRLMAEVEKRQARHLALLEEEKAEHQAMLGRVDVLSRILQKG